MLDQARFLEVADEAVAHLERLMEHYPCLVSSHVRTTVERWEERIHRRGSSAMATVESNLVEEDPLSAAATELLESHQMEDVMELLAEEFSVVVDYQRLIALVGKDCYINALRREASELKMNSISFEQMAELWNGMGKPPLGSDRWTTRSISILTE